MSVTTAIIITADPLGPAARAKGNRDRAAPVVTPRLLAGHLGDPRAVPFDARFVGRPFVIKTGLQALSCGGFVWAVWKALGGLG